MAANEVVTVNVQDFIELLLRRMADEQLAPMKAQLEETQKDVAILKYAVMGNGVPSLAEQIQKLDESNTKTHRAIFARIDEVKKDKQPPGEPPVVAEEFNKWKWMFHGAWITITGVAALAASLATIWKGLHH